MKMILYNIFIILLIFLSFRAWGFSNYSFNAFGEMSLPLDARSRAMGGASAGFYGFSEINPASTGDIQRASFMGSFAPELLNYKSKEQSRTITGMSFPYFKIAFPFSWRGVLGASFSVKSHFKAQNYSETGTIGSYTYKRYIVADGDLNAMCLSYAHSYRNILTVGAGLRYLFGSSEESWVIDFPEDAFFYDTSGRKILLKDTYDKVVDRYLGPGWVMGAIFRLPSDFNIGFSVISNRKLFGDEKISGENSGYENTLKNREYLLPETFAGGVSWKSGNRFLAAADILYTPWENARNNGQKLDECFNTTVISAGFEYFLKGREDQYFSKNFPIRAGFSHNPYYFKDRYGNKIYENKFTFGTGFELPGNSGRIDITAEYLKRGKIQNNPLKEDEWILIFSLTGFEIWSRKLE